MQLYRLQDLAFVADDVIFRQTRLHAMLPAPVLAGLGVGLVCMYGYRQTAYRSVPAALRE